MKSFVVLALLVAAAAAAPAGGPDAAAETVRFVNNNDIDRYNYDVGTSNGINFQEEGQLNDAGTENEYLSVRGAFSYQAPDGVVYEVTYTADKDGFHPTGIHLPKAP